MRASSSRRSPPRPRSWPRSPKRSRPRPPSRSRAASPRCSRRSAEPPRSQLGYFQQYPLRRLRATRLDRVVPFGVERIPLDGELAHLGLADPDALLVGALVEGAFDLQTGFGRRAPDQLDHRRPAFQRLAAPVLRDVAEQPVLDLVPLRGARRIVVDV